LDKLGSEVPSLGTFSLDMLGLDMLGLDVLGLDMLGLDVLGLDMLGILTAELLTCHWSGLGLPKTCAGKRRNSTAWTGFPKGSSTTAHITDASGKEAQLKIGV
jgi:hypothetical protein